MSSVTNVINSINEYVSNHNIEGKARRFKLTIGSVGSVVYLSKKSYSSVAKIKRILAPYINTDLKVEDVSVLPGISYKINGKKFYKNYVEVLVYVSDFPVEINSDDYGQFMCQESRKLRNNKNSRDKRISTLYSMDGLLNQGRVVCR